MKKFKSRLFKGLVYFIFSVMIFSLSMIGTIAQAHYASVKVDKTITRFEKMPATWTISKTADKDEIKVSKNMAEKINYTINLQRHESDSWIIAGKITIKNESKTKKVKIYKIADWLFCDCSWNSIITGKYKLTLTKDDQVFGPIYYKISDSILDPVIWQNFDYLLDADKKVTFNYELIFKGDFPEGKHCDQKSNAFYVGVMLDDQTPPTYPNWENGDQTKLPNLALPAPIKVKDFESVMPNNEGVTFKVESVKIEGVLQDNITGPWIIRNTSEIEIAKTIYGNIKGTYELKNTAKIIGGLSDSITIPIKVVAPDLQVEKSVSPAKIYPGDIVTFKIEIKNNGDGKAKKIKIKDTLTPGFSYVSGSSTPDIEPSGTNPLVWSIGDLSAGKSFTLTYKVKVADSAKPGIYANNVEVTCRDCVAINDKAEVEVLEKEVTPQGGGEEPKAPIISAEQLPITGVDVNLLYLALLSLVSAGVGFAIQRKEK